MGKEMKAVLGLPLWILVSIILVAVVIAVIIMFTTNFYGVRTALERAVNAIIDSLTPW